jgi:hypothetical protein
VSHHLHKPLYTVTLGVLTTVKTTVMLFCVLSLWACRSIPWIGRNIMCLCWEPKYIEDGDSVFLWNVFISLQVHTASNATRKSIVLNIWIQQLHLNSTSVRSILIAASYQSLGQTSGLSFSSLRTKVFCAFVVSRLHTNRPTHMTVLDFIIPIYNVWRRVQII